MLEIYAYFRLVRSDSIDIQAESLKIWTKVVSGEIQRVNGSLYVWPSKIKNPHDVRCSLTHQWHMEFLVQYGFRSYVFLKTKTMIDW